MRGFSVLLPGTASNLGPTVVTESFSPREGIFCFATLPETARSVSSNSGRGYVSVPVRGFSVLLLGRVPEGWVGKVVTVVSVPVRGFSVLLLW